MISAGHIGAMRRRSQIRHEQVPRARRERKIPDAGRGDGQARCVDAAPLRLPLPARRRGHPADGRGQDPALSGHPVPACLAAGAERRHAPPRQPGQDRSTASRPGARSAPIRAIRSNFIVGFPGETEDDFEFLLDWVEEAEIDRAGCFKFEPVKGAPAQSIRGAWCPTSSSTRRFERLMEVAQAVSAAPALRPRRSAARSKCWSTTCARPKASAIARAKWDAPRYRRPGERHRSRRGHQAGRASCWCHGDRLGRIRSCLRGAGERARTLFQLLTGAGARPSRLEQGELQPEPLRTLSAVSRIDCRAPI